MEKFVTSVRTHDDVRPSKRQYSGCKLDRDETWSVGSTQTGGRSRDLHSGDKRIVD